MGQSLKFYFLVIYMEIEVMVVGSPFLALKHSVRHWSMKLSGRSVGKSLFAALPLSSPLPSSIHQATKSSMSEGRLIHILE